MAGYTGGRIKRIRIRNFMTYDDVEFFPKSGLNLIVGLNGSGKSSIMCAICLGLAGKPQFTGRALSLADFIKHGQEEAEIEIELESVIERRVIITRKIKGDKGEWHLNRNLSNLLEVSSLVRSFNINTSNLCQFLPQEKVVEFSRMNKIQRLENLLQAIGEPYLFVLYTELKNMFKECVDIENRIKKFQQNKSSAEEKNDRISGDVIQQENRVRLKRELEDLLKHKQVKEYDLLQQEVKALRGEKKSLQTELFQLTQQKTLGISKESSIISVYQEHAGICIQLKKNIQAHLQTLSDNSSNLAKLYERVQDAKIEYDNKLAEKGAQLRRLTDVNKQIESLEEQLREEAHKKNIVDKKYEDNIKSLSELCSDISDLNQQVETASTKKNSVIYTLKNLTSQLISLRDEHNKRLKVLQRIDKYTHEAVLWLNQNQQGFKSKICMPIILEVKVNSSVHCKYIENHISMRDMLAFVCEDKNDVKRLTEILKNQKKLPVNIVMAPDIPLSHFKSPPIPEEFKQCGLEDYLIDLITAPSPVMRYLCSCYHIQSTPVATTGVDERKIDAIIQKYHRFYNGNVKVSGTKSRYGNHNWSVRQDFISNRNLLVNTDDDMLQKVEVTYQEKERELRACIEECEKLNQKLVTKEVEQEKLRNERKGFLECQKRYKSILNTLSVKKDYQSQITATVINEEEEKEKMTQIVHDVIQAKVKILSSSSEFYKDLYQLHKQSIRETLLMNSLSKDLKLTRAANELICDQVKELERKITHLQQKIEEKKSPARELYEKIVNCDTNFSKSILKETLETIEEMIIHIQAQLNLNEDNEPVIREFEARKQQIAEIEEDIDKLKIHLEDLMENMEIKKKEWLDPLQLHVSNINKKFSRYFKHLHCAGEISLDVPENPNDFLKYGLQIRLKFQDDQPMKELSNAHHSGGECSVTAIIFILSLQELTEVPFRCIDEINQGMDSIYERKIYQLISESVKDNNRSQYFLLTPKLLMDLKYPDDVAVHIIHNSNFLNHKLDIKKILNIAKSLQN